VDRLPLLVSVPHAGLVVPPEVKDLCVLGQGDIVADGDEGSREIYDIQNHVAALVTTEVPRAIVDVNRSAADRRDDGVVKTVTIWNKPVYSAPLHEKSIQGLITKYYEPYHKKLTQLSKSKVILGIDCHTMVAEAPPIGPDPGSKRPDLCVSNADGTCPDEWIRAFASCIEEAFGREVFVNRPFRGGYIIRSHANELPWVQIEMARREFMSLEEKKQRVLDSLKMFCFRIL